MGQRLNIEIVEGEKVLANSYYHWSAYTSSSIKLTKLILEKMSEANEMIPLKKAVFLLQSTDAGFAGDELEYARKIAELNGLDLANASGRSEGLIGISETAINEPRRWEEGRVTIDIEKETINFKVWWESSDEDFVTDYPEGKLVDLEIDLENIAFDKFDDFARSFVWRKGESDGFRINGSIIIPIE